MMNATGTSVVWIIAGNIVEAIVESPRSFGEVLATLDPFAARDERPYLYELASRDARDVYEVCPATLRCHGVA